jgi:NADH-quinone oxidoreductase subunit H
MTLKVILVYMLMMVVRGTLPRLRIDQMMDFTWKVMTPLMMGMFVGIIIIDRATVGLTPWLRAGAFLVFNFISAVIALWALGKHSLPKPKEFPLEDLNAS